MTLMAWFLIAVAVLFAASAIKILNEYERGVIFLLGRFWKVKGPGLIIIVPGIQRMVRVDLRTIVMDVPEQSLISKDNVAATVTAVIYFRAVDPQRAVIQIEDPVEATGQLAQTTLRSVLGQHTLDEMLSERDKLSASIQKILDQTTDPWGIKVSNVEIKQVEVGSTMLRAIAAQAEAERARRAKIIHAEGELQASKQLSAAAGVLAAHPEAMQLRYLQSLSRLSNRSKSRTIVFPLPVDSVDPAGLPLGRSAEGSVSPPEPEPQ